MKKVIEKWIAYDNRYEVSDFGNIRSIERVCSTGRRIPSQLLKPQKVGNYLAIYIWDSEKKKSVWKYIHRMVAELFIPNPDNLPQVNHKDQNPLNNNVENLEWCTLQYNNNYMDVRKRAKATLRAKRVAKGWIPPEEREEGWKRKMAREYYHKKHPNAKYYTITKTNRACLKGMTEEEKKEYLKEYKKEYGKRHAKK